MHWNTELHILKTRDFIINSNSLVDYRYENHSEAITDTKKIPVDMIKLRWDFNYILLDLNINSPIVPELLEFLNFRNISFLNEIINLNNIKAKLEGNNEFEKDNIKFCYLKSITHEIELTVQGYRFFCIGKDFIDQENEVFFDLSYIYLTIRKNFEIELAMFFNINPEEITENHFDIVKMYIT